MIKRKLNDEENKSNFPLLYTCLSLLLLCFFIFLVSNSVTDPNRKKVAIGSLIGSFGFFKNGIVIYGDAEKKEIGFSLVPISHDKNLLQDLIDITKLYKRENIMLLEVEGNKINIKFRKNTIFRNNSLSLNRTYTPILQRIINRISQLKKISLNIYSYNNNPYISSYRVYNLAKFFVSKSNITFRQVSGYGNLNDSNYNIKIALSGVSKTKKASNNQIKYGDFIFRVK